jgi:radical SAM superfamily enzyme YgiQ (UPF0313 family)
MKVLFIYPVPCSSDKVYTGFHQGVGSLSAVLKTHGHRTALYITSEFDANEVTRRIEQEQPDLVGISVTTNQASLAKEIATFLTSHHTVPVVMGGIHATVAPDDLLTVPGILGVCVGEGEQCLVTITEALARGGDPRRAAPNLHYLKDGQIQRNALAMLEDVESLPRVDREIFDFQTMIDRYAHIIGAEFSGSRGCPYHCTYCANQHLNHLYGRGHYRLRRPGSLIDEITAVRGQYHFPLVGFHDDTFTFDPTWLEEFCGHYLREVRLLFWCNTRVDCLDEKRVKLLRRAGCVRLHIGIESGSENLRKNVLHRPFTNQQVLEAFRLAKQQGLKTLAFNMIGLPYETEADILQTIELNRAVRPDRIHLTVFYPYPGTGLYEICRQEGWLGGGPMDNFYCPDAGLDQPLLPREVVARYCRKFTALVYGH